ncbi:EndoU domain-containing protein, partial [Bacillus cereus]|uniref:EndoU domain-containing protein n=1 Tax=Bacillus cereus TaxID=1396 RepID=UPI00356F0FEA
WDKDVVNGDAESRTKFFTYGLTQLAFGVLGDKGVSKVVKVAKGVKMSQGMTELPQLFNKGDNLAIAGGGGLRSGFDTPDFRQAKDTLLFFNPYKSHPDSIYKNNRTVEHIFHGNLNREGDAGGYHHVSMMGEGEILRVTRPPNRYGVYEAEVSVNGVPKALPSTFFPDHWGRTEVLKAIEVAYNKVYSGRGNRYIGTAPNGMKIRLFVDSNGRIISAFPLY